MTQETRKQTVGEVIDEGSKLFKYGLLWWFVQRRFIGGDYLYGRWIKSGMTEKEIHDKLMGVVAEYLLFDSGYDR